MTALFDLEAEEAVIGGLLWDGRGDLGNMFRVVSLLDPSDFEDPHCRTIYASMHRIFTAGQTVNHVAVQHDLNSRGEMATAGGAVHLEALVRKLTYPEGIEWWAAAIKASSARRRMFDLLTRAVTETNRGTDLEQILDRIEGGIEALRAGARIGTPSQTPADIARQLYDETVEFFQDPTVIRGIPMGFSGLDFLLDGLLPGNLIVAGAATSLGKSLFCHNIVRALCNRGVPVTLWTTEMSPLAAEERMAYMEAGVDKQALRRRAMNDEGPPTQAEMLAVYAAIERVHDWPIRYAKAANPNIATIRAEARRDKALRNCDVQIVDHLGKVRAEGRTTIERTAAVTDGLAGIAGDENVVVLATSQVTRDSQKSGRFLALSDLANASNVEQDASQVLLLTPFRWEGNTMQPMYDFEARETMARDGLLPVNIAVAKQRRASTGNVPSQVNWLKGGRIAGFDGD